MNNLPATIEDQLPPDIQDIVDAMKADQTAKIERVGKEVAKKRDEAVKARKASGIEEIWEEDQEYIQGIDEGNRSHHTWLKSPSSAGGLTRDSSKKINRCTSFFNMTRPHVDSATARMTDILLPAGDWNFSCKATPVQDDDTPEVVLPAPLPQMDATGQPVAAPPVDTDSPDPRQMDADRRAEKAELWIQDKLVECSYHAEVRAVVEDAASVGTGILKGPFPAKTITRKATKGDDGMHTLEIKSVITPVSKRVDYWDFFPDPCCGENIQNGTYVLERDRLTPYALKQLKGVPGYLDDQIDQVLDEGPSKKNYIDGIRKTDDDADDEMFHVWYFHGYIDTAGLSAMKVTLSDKESAKDMLPAIVTLVNDTPIKATISLLDSGEFPYDLMPWQRVVGSPWGIGVARQGRTAQDMLNASARALMDNAGLSSGPQLIITRGVIEPADGKWEVTPRKVWWRVPGGDDINKEAFQAVNIPMMEQEMVGIIQLAYKMMEDFTGISFLLQGQQGSAPDTVGGMELLHRNASAILRRLARVFDERVTEPHIRRYYEWLLLHGPENAKGDLKIEAIGSTALVEREIQANQAMVLLQLSLNPMFGIDPAKAMEQVLRIQRFIPEKWTRGANNPAAAPMIPAIEVQKLRSADAANALALEKDKLMADNTLEKHKVDTITDRAREYADSMASREQITANTRLHELQVKENLEMLSYANKRNISLDQIKSELAKESMRLRTQKELAAVAHAAESPSHIPAAEEPQPTEAPPVQLPGKAPDGHAFDQI